MLTDNAKMEEIRNTTLTPAQRAVQNKTFKATLKTPKLTRKEKDSIMADLGLTKVRGSVSGRVYYE